MTIYVDNVRHHFRGMIMCHMWSNEGEEELLAFARSIGLDPRWLQRPPKASWVHFDISLGTKQKAIKAGAILTDKYGPLQHVANLRMKNAKDKSELEKAKMMLLRIGELRSRPNQVVIQPSLEL